jgi:hypothetical protein
VGEKKDKICGIKAEAKAWSPRMLAALFNIIKGSKM